MELMIPEGRPRGVAQTGRHPRVVKSTTLLPIDARRVAPEVLEVIIAPRLVIEEMHDEVAVVEQHPMRFVVPLDADLAIAELGECTIDFIRHRVDLAAARSTGNYEEVDKGSQLPQVDDQNVTPPIVGRHTSTQPRPVQRGGQL